MDKRHPLSWIKRLRTANKIDQAFDLLIANSYFAGQFGQQIPVDESRECFEHIKRLLKK